jgi:uncharacterized protein (TIGR03643 family)
MRPIEEIDRIVEMAWEDRTPFDAICSQFRATEAEVIKIMRNELKPGAFKRWRKRVNGRKTKHTVNSVVTGSRFKCNRQRMISGNRISKR